MSVWGDCQASDPGGSSIKYIRPDYIIFNKYNYKSVHIPACVLGSVCFRLATFHAVGFLLRRPGLGSGG